MKADYGFEIEGEGEVRTLVVAQSGAATRKAQMMLTILCGMVVTAAVFMGEIFVDLRHASSANHGLSFLLGLVTVGTAFAVRSRKLGKARIRLTPAFLEAGGQRYNAGDIQDISVENPQDVLVSASNAAMANYQRNEAEKVLAEKYGVSFKYGRRRVKVIGKLTYEQASDVCGELISWLRSRHADVAA